MELSELLSLGINHQASDLHLSSGLPPLLRINGELRKVNLPVLAAAQVKDLVYQVMNAKNAKLFAEQLEVDFAFELPSGARFRANVFMQARGIAAVFRNIPGTICSLEQLQAPSILREIATYPQGMVLVSGATGSGKSTTLAAVVDFINETAAQHILTIEDPIEFVHSSKQSLINQRELSSHTLSFATALKSALREDPDCILVGELRDLETIRMALTAAETGHLLLGTLHTATAATTIDRIIDVFPAAEKEMVRVMLSESLRAVISQRLLKKKDGSGRIALYEVMIVTPAIKNLIRENKIAQITSAMQTGQQYGMQTMDQALVRAVKQGAIAAATAAIHAQNKELFPAPAPASRWTEY